MNALLAYTPDQVCRVTGLTRRQLAYWDDTGFFRPRFAAEGRRFSRMYGFRDVVGLRTIAKLRTRLPLQELRRIGAWLNERYEEPWSSLRFFVVGRSVVFEDTDSLRGLAGSDQTVLDIRLEEVEHEADVAARRLTERTNEQVGRIVRNRYIQHNAWLIDGTRIPTSAIWNFHEAGYDALAIVSEYPRLTTKDVRAAIEFESCARSAAV